MKEMLLEDELGLTIGLDPEDGYNPLEFIEGEDDEDWLEDDSLLLPSALPPETVAPKAQAAVYSPERAGSVAQAVRDLVTTNAGRRAILLSIIDWSREGVPASELFDRITEAQVHNLSVYEPVSYCRMLERAGAVRLELIEAGPGECVDGAAKSVDPAPEAEDSATAVGYLTIEDDLDPVWRSTEEGLAIYEELIRGSEWREKVLGEDIRYAEVYLAVMNLLIDGGKPKSEIVELAETFEVTKEPRKWGAYFIDVLEATCAIQWANDEWHLTDLGRELLPELAHLCEQRR